MAKGGQGELGIRPDHIKRLEEIQDDIDSIDGKIAKLRKEKRELNTEAVGIWQEHSLQPMVRGSNEWFLEESQAKMKRRRAKLEKEEKKGAGKKGAAEGERKTA
jgi:hypothetical protein